MSGTQPCFELAGMLAALRLRAGLSVYAVGERSTSSNSHIRQVFQGRYCPSTELVEQLVQILGATEEEAREVRAVADRARVEYGDRRRRAAAVAARGPRTRMAICRGPCTHDRQMAPHDPDKDDEDLDRDDECKHYAECLGAFDKAHPSAKGAHCPPTCSKRERPDPKTLHAFRISEATSGGTWAWDRFPSGFPGKGRPGRAA